ncbi:putative short transient receptor potential channel 2-like protein [Rana temporaria]|uniref:putative short transient receptor potential channel 2-like protein n=1 Tax=Rana temporaria TaxID=8407 RepID=UPI001AADD24C|nr:putative short transient receptor potential channel 2-like protein [Rana temporaria]XP_040195806.1 putative short transient receptor potential channel 2-like protein [Rana temporaria]
MAPIRIQHVVSFSSQDPRHPVDNLLSDNIQPWLSCPRDRSRQLKVELQLERASHIAYIDVGNSGSAFFQIDVGRSSGPVGQPFVPLLPTATLMSPADSKLEKNARGVRMFKEGDFLEETAGEKWDRLRITCSQPFNKQAQFGLSFIRLRSALEEEDQNCAPETNTHQEYKSSLLSGMLPGKLQKEEDTNNRDPREERIKERLQRVMSPPSPRTPCLSRTVRMVLSATQSRKRSYPVTSPSSSPTPLQPGEGDGQHGESPVSSGSCPETSVTPSKPKYCGNSSNRGRQRTVRTRGRGRRPSGNPQRKERGGQYPTQLPPPGTSCCPICAGYFPADALPVHASSCGEVYQPPSIVLSSSDDDSLDGFQVIRDVPESWVTCPLCAFRFLSTEIEQHASMCGE